MGSLRICDSLSMQSALSDVTDESGTTLESIFVASEIRRYELESFAAFNQVIDRCQLFDQMVYSQFKSRTTINAIDCYTTRVRQSITSNIESVMVEIDENFSQSDNSSTKKLIKPKRSKHKRTKILFAISGGLVVLLSCLIPTVYYLIQSENVCYTTSCILESARILGKMNQQHEPCTDFYAFVCDNFDKETVIPREKSKITSISAAENEMKRQLLSLLIKPVEENEIEPFQNAKKLFKACNDIDAIESTGKKEVLRLLKYNPVVGIEKWSEYEPRWKWQRFDEQAYNYGMLGPYFLSFEFMTDPRNSRKQIIKIGPPKMIIDRESLLNNAELVQVYYNYQVDVAELLGANYTKAKVQMRESLDFEIQIAKISVDTSKSHRNISNTHTISSLNDDYPYNDWLTYFQNLLPDGNLTLSDRVFVEVPSYFKSLGKLISTTQKRAYINYGFWRMTYDSTSFLPSAFRGRHQEYQRKISGRETNEPREFECVDITLDYFTVAVGVMYARQQLKERESFVDIEEKISEMFGYLKIAVKEIVQEADWMDNETKTSAMELIDEMTMQIGSSADDIEDQEIIKHYKAPGDFNITENKFYESTRSLNIAYRTQSKLGIVGHENYLKDKLTPSFKAEYSFEDNQIKVPTVLLKYFFKNDRPNFSNFGAIGFVIARKMMRAVTSNLEKWWTPDTKENFTQQSECLIEMYGNFTETLTNLSLKGDSTLKENIVDNSGLKAAYKAYVLWNKKNTDSLQPGLSFSPRQMFWISAGQIWCSSHREQAMKEIISKGSKSPDRFRTTGSVINSEKFAKDFECAEGSPMNPVTRCEIW